MIEVKICGLTNRDDVLVALECGADYVGFVLYAGSPRGVTGIELAGILDAVDVQCRPVGVFVNEDPGEVVRIARDCNLYGIQLHGDENAWDFDSLPSVAWRALKIIDGVCVPDPSSWNVERYVLDAAVAGEYGGTGTIADWDVAAAIARNRKLMLAGGLTPDNVAEAVAKVRPAGVDTASGVEKEPGRKDHQKIEDFIKAAKNAVTA